MSSLTTGGGSGRSIFTTGPSFTLENFSNKDFIVRDFVESLAESAVPANRRSGPTQQTFDPKPLIRTFENALSQLAALSEELQEKETGLLTSVRRAEIQHDQTLDTLGRKLDQSIDSFEALDISLSGTNGTNGISSTNGTNGAYGHERNGRSDQGGNIAVQIGERLEDLDKKRRRALDANFLIKCWIEVSENGNLASLEEMNRRRGDGENKVRCAIIARQLMRMSQRLDPASWAQTNGSKKSNGVLNGVTGYKGHNTREIIEKFAETLEKDLLKQFDDSYRKQNFDDMLECAKVLRDFNGGASVVALFVNQHQFFIDRNQLVTEEVTTDGDTWEKVADPDSSPPGVEPSLQSLVDEIRVVMQDESFIIKRAFPYYDVVLKKFIQRIFQQSIQQRLEMVLEKADTISSLAFLRSLHASRSYISQLIEDLKSHGLTEHPEACSTQTSVILDQQLEELFVPYLVGNSYIDREKKSLEELYSSLLFKFTIYHSRRKKVPSGFMASLAQQGTHLLATAKDAYIDRLDSSELTPTQKRMMLRLAGLRDIDNNKNDIEVTDEDGIVSVAHAKRMFKWLAESVRRALELGSGSDAPKDVSALLNLLLASMGQVYIETALDAATDQALAQEASKSEPDLAYLPSLQSVIIITNMMSRFINTVLIRLAESNITVRRSMENQAKSSIETIEKKTNSVIRSTVDVIINWVTKLLAGQKKLDFRPKDSDLDGGRAGSGYLESLQTQTCFSICTFLNRAAALSAQAIDGHNLEAFSNEIGLRIRDLLIEHFKKFQVSATGGLMVTKDISIYVSTLKDWPLSKETEASVEALSEIGNLFIIGPEALKERARNVVASGTTGKKLSKSDFRAFVLKRDDSSSVGVQSVLAGL
ncbi:exocyst complex component Sec10-like protein [Xylogone sp. PMI_703]|nr:exocyst complex component Sec10-like protein [Xylogone sp. PMI_703]